MLAPWTGSSLGRGPKRYLICPSVLQVHALVGSPTSLQESESAKAFAAMVSELLPRASQQLQRFLQGCSSGKAKSGGGGGGGRSAPTPPGPEAVAAAQAAQQLWPLGQRLFLMQLLDSLEGTPGGMELFAQMCDEAMRSIPEIARVLSVAGQKVPGTWEGGGRAITAGPCPPVVPLTSHCSLYLPAPLISLYAMHRPPQSPQHAGLCPKPAATAVALAGPHTGTSTGGPTRRDPRSRCGQPGCGVPEHAQGSRARPGALLQVDCGAWGGGATKTSRV